MPFYLLTEPPQYSKVLFFDNDIEKSKYLHSMILDYKSVRLKFTGTITKVESLFDSIYTDFCNSASYVPYERVEFETTIFDEITSKFNLEQEFGVTSFYAEQIIYLYCRLVEIYGKDLIVKEFPKEVFDLKFIESMIKLYENELDATMADYLDGNYVEYKETLPRMSEWERQAEAEEIMRRIQNEGYY